MSNEKKKKSTSLQRCKKIVTYTLSTDEDNDSINEDSSDEEFDIDEYNLMMEASYESKIDSNVQKTGICKSRHSNDRRVLMEVELEHEKETKNSYPWVKELQCLDKNAGTS